MEALSRPPDLLRNNDSVWKKGFTAGCPLHLIHGILQCHYGPLHIRSRAPPFAGITRDNAQPPPQCDYLLLAFSKHLGIGLLSVSFPCRLVFGSRSLELV